MESKEVPRYDFTINDGNLEEDVKEFVSKFIRKNWKKQDIKNHKFTDGISNLLVGSFVAESLSSADDVVLTRIYGEGSELFIDRDVEMRNMQFLHKHGCAGQVYGRFANGLCYEFIPGEVGTLEMVNDPVYSKMIAKEMARWHSLNFEPPPKDCDGVFSMIRRFMKLVPDKFADPEMQKRYDAHFPSKSDILKDMEDVRSRIDLDGVELVFSHNDLLIKNIVLTADKQAIRFIDYEYGEFNYLGFDVGDHFQEFAGVEEMDYSKCPDEQFQKEWIQCYLETRNSLLGRNPPTANDVNRLYVLANKLSLLSHIMWAVWALVQAKHSKIDFDYMGFGITRYEEYKRRREEFLSLEVTEAAGDV